MVGDPKWLADLDKIEAEVRIKCRRCRFEDDWSVADLTAHLLAIGGSTVWSEVTRHLTCRRHGCGSRDLRAVPVPYARRQANVPRQIGKLDEQLIRTAVEVLEHAVTHAQGQAVNTLEVRLALLVVHRYARDGETCRLFWRLAAKSARSVNEGLRAPLDVLRWRLEQGGWIAPRVLLDRTPTWPWNSPAPPGWKAGPGSPARIIEE